MRPLAVIALAAALVAPDRALAESVAVALVETQGLSEAQARRALKQAEGALARLSALEVRRGGLGKRGGPRRSCRDELPCLAAAAEATGADSALLLSLKAAGGRLSGEGYFVEDGQARRQRLDEEGGEDSEAPLRALVEALLPGWARKGFGGLVLEVPPGAQVKIDGERAQPASAGPLALTAQVHSVDVLFESGQAVLQRLSVPEGDRLRVQVSAAAGVDGLVSGARGRSDERVRAVSYGLWGAGALAIAGSLYAGALSRRAAADLATCQGTSRACLPYDEAQVRRAQAEAYARTGNLLLATGAVLAVSGAGLFAFDEVRSRAQEAP